MDYSYPEHYTDSIFSAIELAEFLKASGKYDLFRGQRHTFPIQPSVFRPGADRQAAQQQVDEFAIWSHNTPDLASLHDNEHAILAVAQHYGLKTPLLDVTRSPRIAGFFATDGGEEGDTGVIICINRERFIESWKDLNKNYLSDKGVMLTELINIDVNNLWRLQAQEGEFLRCHVDPTMLEMFSGFMRIYFPQAKNLEIIKQENIYPTEKSHLEVLLDQYFLIDSYPDRFKKLEEIFGGMIHGPSEVEAQDEQARFFVNQQIPETHESWLSDKAMVWLDEPSEDYHDNKAVQVVQLVFSPAATLAELETALDRQLADITTHWGETQRPVLQWELVDENNNTLYVVDGEILTDKDDEYADYSDYIEHSMADMVNTLYSGMRYLPYSNRQISRVIKRYITMSIFSMYEFMSESADVEFSGGGVRGRSLASKHRILGALRDDFYTLIAPEKLNPEGAMDFRDNLFAARHLKSSYDFNKFIDLFVEDLLPSQAVIAIEGLVIGVNPMRLDVFGES